MAEFHIHYYLEDNNHAINALTLYKSQEELHHLVKEIAATFGIELKIKVYPPEEGGFVHFLSFVGENVAAITLITTLLGSILGGAAWLVYQRPLLNQQQVINSQQQSINDQQINKNKLEIEKTKIELERLKIEAIKDKLEKDSRIPNDRNMLLDFGGFPEEEELISILLENKKIVKRISNIYHSINQDFDIRAIGYKNDKTINEIIVDREKFEDFIVGDVLIEDAIINDAVIEITAPVLNEKSIKWHGIFGDKNIGFSINDSLFKELVLKRKIIFKNGSKIICSLRMLRRINSIGEIEIYDYVAENIQPIK